MEPIQKTLEPFKLVAVILSLFLVVSLFVKIKESRYIGSGMSATNTITVSGQGKIERAPDTAKITFTVRNESKTIKAAQDAVSAKVDAATKALKDLGIDEKHIKTDSYSSYPQYDYPRVSCTQFSCPPSTPIIRGYEVTHTITVAVKDLDKANDVLGAIGTAGVSDISGPNFGFEDDTAIAREARALAIDDAKDQAKALARDLGVRLVRIVSFNENGGAVPMYARAEMDAGAANQKLEAPSLPVGDQKVQSNVTIVYEIR